MRRRRTGKTIGSEIPARHEEVEATSWKKDERENGRNIERDQKKKEAVTRWCCQSQVEETQSSKIKNTVVGEER